MHSNIITLYGLLYYGESIMGKRLEISNPFYDGNASASAFGWQFQVDAALFLFIQYIESVESITVEGKNQDIELTLKDGSKIFAQAKSISDSSSKYKLQKLEDAIISLAKTSHNSSDNLLYISNYNNPLSTPGIFNNKSIKLVNAAEDKEEFEKQINRIKDRLNKYIESSDCKKKDLYNELIKRIDNMNIDDFIVSSIFPYANTEYQYDKFIEIENKINELLTNKFCIQSVYLKRFIREILLEWQQKFFYDATINPEKNYKMLSKEDLLWQIVVVLAKIDYNKILELIDDYLEDDFIEHCETIYQKTSYVHQRFSFFNELQKDYMMFCKQNGKTPITEFVKKAWMKYRDEYLEFKDYTEKEKEYLIKKSLFSLLNNRNNIMKIIER